MKSYYEVVDENIDWPDQVVVAYCGLTLESISILSSFIPEILTPAINLIPHH